MIVLVVKNNEIFEIVFSYKVCLQYLLYYHNAIIIISALCYNYVCN